MPEFEIRISVEGGDGAYFVEHRMPDRPGVETLVLLKEEACGHFEKLYPDALISESSVSVTCVDSPPMVEREYVLLENEE